jgi:hypothetical protein
MLKVHDGFLNTCKTDSSQNIFALNSYKQELNSLETSCDNEER